MAGPSEDNTGTGSPVASRLRWFDPVWLALLAGLVYRLFERTTLYYFDGHMMLRALNDGRVTWPDHNLALPLFRGVQKVFASVGDGAVLHPRDAIVVTGIVSSAVAVGLVAVLASQCGLARRRALGAALLFGTCPPIWMFSSVVEIHGTFAGFAVLTLVGYRWLWSAPSPLRAVGAVLVGSVTAQIHAVGIALPCLALAYFALVGQRSQEGRLLSWRFVVPVVLVHLALCFGAIAVFERVGWRPSIERDVPLEHWVSFAEAQVERLPLYLWREWMIAAPSLAFLSGSLWFSHFRTRRPWALGFVLVAHVLLCGMAGVAHPEHGAYFTGMVVFAAIQVAASLPGSWVLYGCVVSASVSLARHFEQDTVGDRYDAFARGVVAVAEHPEPVVLLVRATRGDYRDPESTLDAGACVLADPPLPEIDLSDLAFLEPEAVAPLAAGLPALIEQQAGARPVFVSARTLRWLERTDIFPSGPLLAAGLRQIGLEPVEREGFRGFRVGS